MNKFKFFFLISFFSSLAYCQRTSIVEYRVVFGNKNLNDSINNIIKKKTKEMINSIEQNDYELVFNDSISVFNLKKEMLSDNPNNKLSSSLIGGKRYKNLKDSVNIKQKEFLGQIFNIHLKFNNYKWSVTKEKKIISGYTCYKAIAKIIESDFIRKKEIEYFIEAWFTPEIPVPFGPAGIDGLPGLVLEGSSNSGAAVFYVSKLDLLNNEKSIEKVIDLSKGKNISEKDYLIMIKETYLSFRNRN